MVNKLENWNGILCKINLDKSTGSAYVVSDSGPKLHFNSIFLRSNFNLVFLVLLSCPQIHACIFTFKQAASARGTLPLQREKTTFYSVRTHIPRCWPFTTNPAVQSAWETWILKSHDLQWMWYMQRRCLLHWKYNRSSSATLAPTQLRFPYTKSPYPSSTRLRSVGLIHVRITHKSGAGDWESQIHIQYFS